MPGFSIQGRKLRLVYLRVTGHTFSAFLESGIIAEARTAEYGDCFQCHATTTTAKGLLLPGVRCE